MKRFGFIYDQKKCIGCNVCQMACKDKNNLEMGLFFRRTVTVNSEEDPLTFYHFSGACIHCDEAECVKHCPTGAMYRKSDGTVGHRKEKCIGCGICTRVCPQAAPKLSFRDGNGLRQLFLLRPGGGSGFPGPRFQLLQTPLVDHPPEAQALHESQQLRRPPQRPAEARGILAVQRHLAENRREPVGAVGAVPSGREFLPYTVLDLQGVQISVDLRDGAVAPNQIHGGLFADAGHPSVP